MMTMNIIHFVPRDLGPNDLIIVQFFPFNPPVKSVGTDMVIIDANGVLVLDFCSQNPAVNTYCTGLQAVFHVFIGLKAADTP
ncbi:uncharacterized protein CTRU02_215731 [Colletotrichum truncatum]|uniref:Uncharacterized protein n=2 Tax=Colletotrichum truncatum TaxID=5467 RepID=A0ACC3YBX3_COLTU|nr:uncharacterized protein CTRU02_15108 [Colletotrichum truncatum]XP_036575127.1 uncharacterized protein CTRU02_14946 [Colletotrichum truncatum]KAF6781401.1 hypothetical protein CTRU02_15108 [Colletotrichum truncatum]KAF6781648.1 hypothetical protein CTRU02_14946 [Colletotrichum truncatum]